MDEVYDLWVAGGGQGSYGSVNEAQKSVSFDGSSPLVLKNIEFDGGERLPVLIAFEGNSEQSEIPLWVHFRQFLHNEDYETTTPYGNVSFELRTENLKQAPANKPISELSTSQNYSAYPNPTTERLSLQYLGKTTQKGLSWAIYDLNGRVLDTQQHLSLNQGQTLQIEVKDYPPGLYILQITEADGHREQLKFVKQ